MKVNGKTTGSYTTLLHDPSRFSLFFHSNVNIIHPRVNAPQNAPSKIHLYFLINRERLGILYRIQLHNT